MNLAAQQRYIYRRTKTNADAWGTSGVDMIEALNNANEHELSLIRGRSDNFYPTAWTTSDLSTGTAVPVFDSLFHELNPLRVVYQYALDNTPKKAAALLQELQIKETAMLRFYGTRTYKIFTVTIASPGVFTRKAHGLRSGDRVLLSTTGALPTGLSVATWYYVISSGLGEDTFQLSATKDGAAINTSVSQSGTHYFATDTQGRMRPSRESNK